jgi:hypothetical protein
MKGKGEIILNLSCLILLFGGKGKGGEQNPSEANFSSTRKWTDLEARKY